MTLDARIDDFYKRSQDEFVAARNALAKALAGADATRVKALVKPTTLPWSVNQVYWHRRDVYARVLQTGKHVRDAQLAVLAGKKGDVRGAGAAHQQAVAAAVKAASDIASGAGVRADADGLARMFEALSLRTALPEPHGRFTAPLQPQGFEALAGASINVAPHSKSDNTQTRGSRRHTAPASKPADDSRERHEQERREREWEEAGEARRRAAALEAAERTLALAKADEQAAKAEWNRARRAVEDAEQAIADLKPGRPRR